MGMLLKIIPAFLFVKSQTAKLKGSLSSETTTTQMKYAEPAAAAIALLAYFFGAQLPEAYQTALLTLALPVITGVAASPWVRRIMGYKAPLKNAEIELLSVQLEDDVAVWRTFDGIVSEAKDKGYARGLSYKGIIYDLSTGEAIGERETPLRIPDGNKLEDAFVNGIGKRETKQ
jgi:hypothetical protein